MHKAAMKESMAAGLLLEAGYSKDSAANTVLVDPMAGSGSLVLEAAMIAADLAPGLMRIKCGVSGHQKPPVLQWKSSRDENAAEIWRDILVEATERAKEGLRALSSAEKPRILANDIHEGALDILEASLEQAGLQSCVEVHEDDCRDWDLPSLQGEMDRYRYLIATNPPWGVRLSEDMHESWESLRVFLRSCPPGTEAWVLSGNKESTRHLGLKRSRSLSLQTAQQNLRWIQYNILDKPPLQERREAKPPSDSDERQRDEQRRKEAAIKPKANRAVASRKREEPSTRARAAPATVRNDDVRVDPRNKSVLRPLTKTEREDRKNSWLL
jgi:23S rRNA (guanine2445-N2)-methyltransferase / 23S rRNA (guanine2069-N7)-methyltransferase